MDVQRELGRAIRPLTATAIDQLDSLMADLGDSEALMRRAQRHALAAEGDRVAAMTPAEVLGYQVGAIHKALVDVAEGFARGFAAVSSKAGPPC